MIVTLTGASGAGKTSYARELVKLPGWSLVPSWTTRPPREKDLPGEYKHVSHEDFARHESIPDGFLWTAEHHGHRYGTDWADFWSALASTSEPCIMMIDPASVAWLRNHCGPDYFGRMTHFYALSPEESVLRRRLEKRRARDGLSMDEIERRVAECRTWDGEAFASEIPYAFVAADLSIAQAAAFIEARTSRVFGLTPNGRGE